MRRQPFSDTGRDLQIAFCASVIVHAFGLLFLSTQTAGNQTPATIHHSEEVISWMVAEPDEEPVGEVTQLSEEAAESPRVESQQNVGLVPEPEHVITQAPWLEHKPAAEFVGAQPAELSKTSQLESRAFTTGDNPTMVMASVPGLLAPTDNVRTSPRYRKVVRPTYPSSARRLNQQGTVIVALCVSELGKAQNVRILESCGIGALDSAAIRAVAAWEFDAATLNGHPVSAVVEVPVEFRLDRN